MDWPKTPGSNSDFGRVTPRRAPSAHGHSRRHRLSPNHGNECGRTTSFADSNPLGSLHCSCLSFGLMSLAAHFLNVDLEIRSLTDPAALIAEFGDIVIVLHCGAQEPGYLCVLELSQEFPDPDGTILEYCRLIAGLSTDGR